MRRQAAILCAVALLPSAAFSLLPVAGNRPQQFAAARTTVWRTDALCTPLPKEEARSSLMRMSGGNSSSSSSIKLTLSVAAVLSATFLNLLGFTMAGPITPALGKHFGLDVGAALGMLTSAYPLGMLIGLFFWAPLSDRVGRKPVIAISLLGAGVGLAVQGLAIQRGWPLWAFLGLRALTGSMAGSSPVAKAYLADIGSSTGQLPRYMAWRDASSTLAYIVGPLMSGHLFLGQLTVGLTRTMSLAAVISVSAVCSLLAAVLVVAFVSETPPKPLAAAPASLTTIAPASPPTDVMRGGVEDLIACPLGAQLVAAVATVCVVSALFSCGSAPFDAFFPSLVKSLAGMNEIGIGQSKAALAALSLLVSATISARVQRTLGVVGTCVAGLGTSAIGLAGIALVAASPVAQAGATTMHLALFWIAAALYQLGVPLYGPTIPTMLLQCVPRNRRGFIMGLDGSVNTVARIVSAPLLGALYAWGGASACFGTASALVALSALIALGRRLIVMRGLYA